MTSSSFTRSMLLRRHRVERVAAVAIDAVEIRLAGAASPQVSRRLKASLLDLRELASADRRAALDEQLDLLSVAVEDALADERDVAFALGADREGIGAAASAP